MLSAVFSIGIYRVRTASYCLLTTFACCRFFRSTRSGEHIYQVQHNAQTFCAVSALHTHTPVFSVPDLRNRALYRLIRGQASRALTPWISFGGGGGQEMTVLCRRGVSGGMGLKRILYQGQGDKSWRANRSTEPMRDKIPGRHEPGGDGGGEPKILLKSWKS